MGLAAHLQCRPPASQTVEKRSDARLARVESVAWAPLEMPGSKGGGPERHGALRDGELGSPNRGEWTSLRAPTPGVRVGRAAARSWSPQSRRGRPHMSHCPPWPPSDRGASTGVSAALGWDEWYETIRRDERDDTSGAASSSPRRSLSGSWTEEGTADGSSMTDEAPTLPSRGSDEFSDALSSILLATGAERSDDSGLAAAVRAESGARKRRRMRGAAAARRAAAGAVVCDPKQINPTLRLDQRLKGPAATVTPPPGTRPGVGD
eukprot:CAMPEP_0179991302 /NCGR_PEP_ID=MMETSP0984-20121128/4914_1 /TAXON_ID=483367 /ORGANISM="non described non described, Strain CCMP 2436" /LENGTH=263 /DNA_ID=CAMNT_0021910587 /DNA_START=525 /DNA_END=1315 /DNA_ORIENTATION=+